jgi:hypothetical protein
MSASLTTAIISLIALIINIVKNCKRRCQKSPEVRPRPDINAEYSNSEVQRPSTIIQTNAHQISTLNLNITENMPRETSQEEEKKEILKSPGFLTLHLIFQK